MTKQIGASSVSWRIQRRQSIAKVFPNVQELRDGKEPELEPLKAVGQYKNVDEYLRIHYELLREDFLRGFRRIVQSVISKSVVEQDKGRICEEIQLLPPFYYEKENIARYRLQFNTSHPSYNRITGGRPLQQKSLLCLVSPDCETMFLATIEETDHCKDKGWIGVDVKTYIDIGKLRGVSFTMISSPSYCEAYIHSLSVLKSSHATNFAFQDYIVHAGSDMTMPDSRGGMSAVHDISCIMKSKKVTKVRTNNVEEWPELSDTGLNESQYEAFQKALQQEFTTIHGPPGTGKSFLGKMLCRSLMEYCKKQNMKILIVSYTNHALDEFIGSLMKHNNHIVRLGSRSKSESIQGKCLTTLRKERYPVTSTEIKEIYRQRREYRNVFSRYDRILSKTEKALKCGNLIDKKTIKEGNAGSVVDKLMPGEHLEDWLDIDNAIANEKCKREDSAANLKAIVSEKSSSIHFASFIDQVDNNESDDDTDTLTEDEDESVWKAESGDNTEVSDDKKKFILHYCTQAATLDDDEYRAISVRATITLVERWCVYKYWLMKVVHYVSNKLSMLKVRLDELNELRENLLSPSEEAVIKDSEIIAATTTGVATYYNMLCNAGPLVLIVEEAADVLEVNLIPCLMPNVKHAILIGDHMQLKPKTTEHSHEWLKECNFDMSLFKRFSNNRLAIQMLSMQYRMRPEMVEILLPDFYSGLKSDASVANLNEVRGISKSFFFIQLGGSREQVNELTKAYKNKDEADYISALCLHLLRQGYKQSEITIMTPYREQVILLDETIVRDMKTKLNLDKRSITITTVDSYQGEENNIVLLSLVRTDAAGFLDDNNRICVMLSRAKMGLYVVGNFELLRQTCRNSHWKKIIERMEHHERYGDPLKICCEIHKKMESVEFPEDFEQFAPEGGCIKRCTHRYTTCGHQCKSCCHPEDQAHLVNKCKQKCGEEIPCGHTCKKKCHGNNVKHTSPDKCSVDVTRERSCSHERLIKCCLDVEKMSCKENIRHTSDCGHEATVQCNMKSSYTCEERCTVPLPCGHTCSGTCSICKRGRLHIACPVVCEIQLDCGHRCGRKCHATAVCPPCNQPCDDSCQHSTCSKKCYMPCTLCKSQCLQSCEHKPCQRTCGEICKNPPCDEPCRKRLSCGHSCRGLCQEQCPLCPVCSNELYNKLNRYEENCRLITLVDCSHTFEVNAMDTLLDEQTSTTERPPLPKCPTCSVPIRKTLRYGRYTKEAHQRIEMSKGTRYQPNEERNLFVASNPHPLLAERMSKLGDDELTSDVVLQLRKQDELLKELMALEEKIDKFQSEEAWLKRDYDYLKSFVASDGATPQQLEQALNEFYRLLLATVVFWVFHSKTPLTDAEKAMCKKLVLDLRRGAIIDAALIPAYIKEVKKIKTSRPLEKTSVSCSELLKRRCWVECPEKSSVYVSRDAVGSALVKCPGCNGDIANNDHRTMTWNDL